MQRRVVADAHPALPQGNLYCTVKRVHSLPAPAARQRPAPLSRYYHILALPACCRSPRNSVAKKYPCHHRLTRCAISFFHSTEVMRMND